MFCVKFRKSVIKSCLRSITYNVIDAAHSHDAMNAIDNSFVMIPLYRYIKKAKATQTTYVPRALMVVIMKT